MEAEAYRTRLGGTCYRPVVNADELFEGNIGFCIACGTETSGVEPDARNYECESCGAKKVFGLEELLLMGIARLENTE